jgi:hypothetical protein
MDETLMFDVGGWRRKKHLTIAKVGVARLPKGCMYLGTVTCESGKEPTFTGIDPKLEKIVMPHFLATVPLTDRTPQPIQNNREAITAFLAQPSQR